MRSPLVRRNLRALFWAGAALAASEGVSGCAANEPASAIGGAAGSDGAGSSRVTGAGSGGSGSADSMCGDGAVTPPELCDDGNDTNGDGCDNDCSFSCTKGTVVGDAKCDDQDPCNGGETCSDAHACVAGTPEADGTGCGEGKVCKGGVCTDVTCGDQFVDPGEDCDDGNLDPNDGCDACQFTCVVDADCDPADACAGSGICAANHTCAAVDPLAEGTACAGGGTCQGGACVVALCGNGTLEPGEACDDGNVVNGDGCEADCTVTCAVPAADCPAPPPCNKAVCTAQKTCGTAPDAGQDGSSCGVGLTCSNGACLGVGATCGNGVVEAGEDCDFGAGNGPGTGCEAICKYSCTKAPDSCPDQNACNGMEACAPIAVGGKIGQKCSSTGPEAACSACPGGVCAGGTCVPSTCGDGCVDASKGETCEPPNGPTCDAACHAHVCGNGVRETGEDCDDGNTKSLDGCSAACAFEQIQRMRYLVLQYQTDAYCSANRLGAAVVGQTAQSQLQAAIDDGIQTGGIDLLLQFLGLDDLTGTSDPALQIGAMNGTPKALGQPYNGTSDPDFWHQADGAAVDANGVPLALVPAQIAAKSLSAGPGAMTIGVSFGGLPAPLSLSGVKLAITLGTATAPLVTPGVLPPGHKASEHLNPALVSFATAGQANSNGAGKLCGNVSAASLAEVPVPEQLTSGAFACAEGYTLASTMLDVIAGGCTVLGVQQIAPSQPDQVDPGAPPAGAGAPYTLVLDAQHQVVSCNDKNGAQVSLGACVDAAAYSSFFKVAMNRVIAR